MMRRYSFFQFLGLFLTVILFASCGSEYHYAKSFLRKHKRGSKDAVEQIYVCMPKMLYHNNPSLESLTDFATMDPAMQDSLRNLYNQILNNLNDTIFISQFRGALLSTLSRTHVPIVIVDTEAQLPPPSASALILDVAQLEAEEFVELVRSGFNTKQGGYYAYDHDVRHFATNAWFQLNYDTSYYFRSNEISESDAFHGTVTSLKDQRATLQVTYTPIGVNDAYESARNLGTQCAALFIEKVLTEYVHAKKGTNNWYFYYNYIDNDLNVMVPYKVGMDEGFYRIVE